MSDENRRIILARRARFLAAAFATTAVGVGIEACADPEPCLSPIFVPSDAAADDAKAPKDAQTKDAASVSDAGDLADAEPRPCLFAPVDDGG
jgi:hypothetical protein